MFVMFQISSVHMFSKGYHQGSYQYDGKGCDKQSDQPEIHDDGQLPVL